MNAHRVGEGAEKEVIITLGHTAESVCEAIIRHQDLGDTGEITSVGGLVQVVTLLGEPLSHLSSRLGC